MYGPKERVKVHLYLVGSMVLFVGVLALPLLIEEDLVRTDFGSSDGFAVQGGPSDGLFYGRGPETSLRPPNALIQAPAMSGDAAFRVAWDSDGPDPVFLYTYDLQYLVLDEDGEGAWEDWFRHRRSDLPREALFTGAADTTYMLRARACTLGLECGAWSDALQTQVLPDVPEPLVELDLTPKNPHVDQVVDGKVAISWDFDHRGPGDVMVGVSVVPAAGDGAAVPLYSGQGSSVAWDTTRHDDGQHVLRLEVRDGPHVLQREVPVTIANDGLPVASAPAETDAPAGEEGATERAESPFAAVSLVVVALASMLVAVRRRAA